MRELIAVTGFNPLRLDNLKQKAFLFDKIADVALVGHLARLSHVQPDLGAELEWLVSQGIVFAPVADSLPLGPPITPEQLQQLRGRMNEDEHEQLAKALNEYADADRHLYTELASHAASSSSPYQPTRGQSLKIGIDDGRGGTRWVDLGTNERLIKHIHLDKGPKLLRLTALRLRLLDGLDAVPLLDEFYFDRPTPSEAIVQPIGDGRNPVIEVVLKELPVPDDTVAWEQILEFRRDPSAQDAWFRLRDWMNDMAKGSLRERELEEKLQFLLRQFERSMELHDMKATRGPFEAFVTTTAEAVESVLKLKLTRAAEALFIARRRRIDLLQAERTAPGSAVAYIFKARGAFPRQRIQ